MREVDTECISLAQKFLSWRRALVLLLALLVYLAAGLFYNSARSFWLYYEPWFGMPKEVEHYGDFGGMESFDLRLTQEQYKQWVERFQLKEEVVPLRVEQAVMTAMVDLEKIARVTLTKRDYSPDGDKYRLDINYWQSENEPSDEVVKVEKTPHSTALEWFYSIFGIVNFFVLPVVVARFIVGRTTKGCFSFKELFLNLFVSWVLMGLGSFLLIVSNYLFGSYAPDHPLFLMIGSLLSGFLGCGFVCVLYYLLTVVYRCLRRTSVRD